ncbi:MAG TPA: HutP family protein [Bacillota bacterium]
METGGSKEVAKAALAMALSSSRDEEKNLKEHYKVNQIHAAAVDYGGEAIASMRVIVERAVVAAKRELIIAESHPEEGAVAGATREAMAQILTKALGLNIGGKIGIARKGDHIAVAVFFSIGLIHLDEIAVGLSHRAIGQGYHD